MASLNKVMLIGNLTRDPQLTYLPSQMPVVEFGMAVNDRRKQQDGSYADKANFIDLSIFGKRAEALQKHVKKGDPLFVEGILDYQQWEKDGQTRYTTEIVAKDMQMLDSREQQDRTNENGSQPSYTAPPAPDNFDSDDIPF